MEIEIEIIENSDDQMRLILNGLPFAYSSLITKTIGKYVGTVQIEKIEFSKNDSYVHDDELVAALRYVPLKIDPRKIPFCSGPRSDSYNETNSFTFELNVKNTDKTNKNVYTNSLKWKPTENQKKKFNVKNIGPLHPDIFLSVLRPRTELSLKCVAVKRTRKHGRQYSAGFSLALPMKKMRFVREIKNEQAERLQKVFGKDVIGLETVKGETVAVLKRNLIENCSYAIDENLENLLEYDCDVLSSSLTIESQSVLKHSEVFIEGLNRVTKIIDNIWKQLKDD